MQDGFDERHVAAMKGALDLACATLAVAIKPDEQEASGARELLASLIREVASQGEISPKALCDYALRRFSPVLAYYARDVRH